MALTLKAIESLTDRGYSRRQIARVALGAAAAIPFFSEMDMAYAQDDGAPVRGRGGAGGVARPYDPDMVVISSNENPMGPTKEGIEAMAKVGPLGWRYRPQGENLEFQSLLESTENVKSGYVDGYAGSSMPLANAAPAFTSPTRSWVMGSPGYGAGGPRFVGNKVV